eukprot:gene7495-16704_t
MSTLQFAPFSSSADASFWHGLARRKLEVYGLDDASKALADASVVPGNGFRAEGTLYNANTFEDFKAMKVPDMVEGCAKQIWDSIISGDAAKNPSLLNRFALFTFADLKKFKFYYWFGFPALKGGGAEKVTSPPQPISAAFTEAEVASLSTAVSSLCGAGGDGSGSSPRPSVCLLQRSTADGGGLTAHPLTAWPDIAAGAKTKKMTVCVADPSADDERLGWPIRNLLVLLAQQFGGGADLEVTIVAFRETARMGVTDVTASLVFDVTLPPIDATVSVSVAGIPGHFKGLEKDGKGKLKPRLCNLSASMDPKRLAESAVGLNLSLMRWRLLPAIDLPKIAATRLTAGKSATRTQFGRLSSTLKIALKAGNQKR